MSSYSLADEAVQDLNDIWEDIAQSNPSAASKLFDAIRQKCKLVAGFPNMGKSYDKLSPYLRGFAVDDYIVFYYSGFQLDEVQWQPVNSDTLAQAVYSAYLKSAVS